MNLQRTMIRPYLAVRHGFHRLTGTGAFGRDRARYLDSSPDPRWNPLKKSIWKHHVKQYHESSCSVASVVACINALRSLAGGEIRPITQLEILDRVTTGHWKARMSENGHNGRRGLPLPLLGRVVADSIAIYGLRVRSVEAVAAPKEKSAASAALAVLKRRLNAFDRQGEGLIIAHFDQGAFVPTPNIPHISPVGAYDARTRRITVLDVDPDEKQPYEISLETFYKGLSSNYHHMFSPFGYNGGGYVYVRVR